MTKKNKTAIIICVILLVVLIGIQWLFAMPYVMRHDNSIEAQRPQLPIVFVTALGFAAIYYTLFRNVEKKHKIIRGLLIYFTICSGVGMICSLLMMLLL